jgi:hypothetical protein
VSGCVSRRISFRLHDATADPALGKIVHQSLANQKLGEFQRGAREFSPA